MSSGDSSSTYKPSEDSLLGRLHRFDDLRESSLEVVEELGIISSLFQLLQMAGMRDDTLKRRSEDHGDEWNHDCLMLG
jgi:hypothetical protein